MNWPTLLDSFFTSRSNQYSRYHCYHALILFKKRHIDGEKIENTTTHNPVVFQACTCDFGGMKNRGNSRYFARFLAVIQAFQLIPIQKWGNDMLLNLYKTITNFPKSCYGIRTSQKNGIFLPFYQIYSVLNIFYYFQINDENYFISIFSSLYNK